MMLKIDKPLSCKLYEYTRSTIQFGNKDGDDVDLLHIVTPNLQMDYSLLNNNQILFYKDVENKIDNLFVTPRGFIQGIISGSSTLFYELLRDKQLGGYLSPLYNINFKDLVSYRLLKAFIGKCEKDFLQAATHKSPDKKLKWSKIYFEYVKDFIPDEHFNLDMVKDLTHNNIKLVRYMLNSGTELKHIPRDIDIEVFNKLNNMLNIYYSPIDIPALSEVQYIYFKN